MPAFKPMIPCTLCLSTLLLSPLILAQSPTDAKQPSSQSAPSLSEQAAGPHNAGEPQPRKLKAIKIEAGALGATTEQSGAYTTGTMDTATKLDLSPRETPQSVSVITSAQLDDFKITTINEALDTATGVTVRRSETDRTYFEARGFDINNFQVDGLGTPLHWNLLEGDIDMALYDRVEIIRGASGLMSGLGSPAATINLVRKRPTAAPQASISFTHARWDDSRIVADAAGALTSSVRARAVISEQRKDSYLQNYHKDLSSSYGVIEADLGVNTFLTAGISRQESNADSPMWGALTLTYVTDAGETLPTRFDRSLNSSADWAYWDVQTTKGFVELDHTWVNGWNTKATYTRTKTRGAQELLYVFGTLNENMSGLGGWAGKYDRDSKDEQFDITTTGRFSTGALEHKFVVGFTQAEGDLVERAFYDYATGNGFPAINNMAKWTGNTPRPTFNSEDPGADVVDKQTGFYLAGQLSLSEDLKLLTGARAARYTSSGTDYGVDQNTDDDVVVPYAGVTYNLSTALTAYASYTETFTPQTEQDSAKVRLDPTTGTNKEVGLKGEFLEGMLNASLAIFETELQGLAIQLGFNEEIGKFFYGTADYQSRGFEVEIAGQVNENVNMTLGYTNLTVDDSEGEVARTFTPKQSLKLTANYTPEWQPALTLGTFAEYRSDTYLRGTVIEQDALTLIDAFARYQLNSQVSLALNLSNITDESYYTSFEYAQAYYAEPRNVSASITVKF